MHVKAKGGGLAVGPGRKLGSIATTQVSSTDLMKRIEANTMLKFVSLSELEVNFEYLCMESAHDRSVCGFASRNRNAFGVFFRMSFERGTSSAASRKPRFSHFFVGTALIVLCDSAPRPTAVQNTY